MFVLVTGHAWHATGLYLNESTANSSSKLHCSGSNVTCLRKTVVYCLPCDCIRLAETAPTSRLAFVPPPRNCQQCR